MNLRALLVVASALACICMLGCQSNTPRRRTEVRIARIHKTWSGLMDKERERPTHLAATWGKVCARVRKDVRTNRSNCTELQTRIAADHERRCRNLSAIPEAVEKHLRGNSDGAIATAERMFY